MKVLRLSPLRCPSGAASAPSSPMRIGSPEVFSFEEQDGSVHAPLPWEQSPAAALESLRELEACCQPACEAQLMLARHVELAVGGAHKVDVDKLCAVLQRLGYSAKLQQTEVPLHKFSRGVRHAYITVCLPDGSSPAGLSTFIVEPNFRDCFCVAHPTPRYEALLAGTPAAAVLSRAAMYRAASTLAREMARSFADQGDDLPPWRTAQALFSKWQLPGGGAAFAADAAGCSAWAAAGTLHAKHGAFGAA